MKLKLNQIKPNPDNPRVIKDWQYDKLKQSIQDFPEMLSLRPIVIDENNVILGGNMRFRALQELGYKETEVLKASELTESQKKEFIIKDNLPYGEWDMDTLANNWDVDELAGWGLDVSGFEQPEDLDKPEDVRRYTIVIHTNNYEEAENIRGIIGNVLKEAGYHNEIIIS